MPQTKRKFLANDVAIFRRFNRMYTRLLGTLNERLLGSGFSVAEARVLYELAHREAPKAAEIATDLGMDAGYLSRILAKFHRDRLLRRRAAAGDGRLQELALTKPGKKAFEKLNARSEEQAHNVLGNLAPTSRAKLIAGLREVEGVLGTVDELPRSVVLRPHRVGDMGWVVHREGVGYAEQYGWDESFEALVAKIVSEFVMNLDPKREHCWIAEIDGQSVGHIFLVKHPDRPNTAKLRLLFVEPSARGRGVGDALVRECLRFARTAGYETVVLWTQSILGAAHKLYERAGFRLVKEDAHHSFGHDLMGQEWELKLR